MCGKWCRKRRRAGNSRERKLATVSEQASASATVESEVQEQDQVTSKIWLDTNYHPQRMQTMKLCKRRKISLSQRDRGRPRG